jgi:Cysteine-rich secretory protein family
MAALTPDIPQVEIAIVEMTNVFRAEQSLGTVKVNPQLTAAARAYAEFLAKSDLFSHTADGRQHSDRAKTAGYGYCHVSENLSLNLDSRGFQTTQLARDAVEGWKKSPGHRRNLVAPHVTEIGVGVAKARGSEKYLSVQMFGRPETLKYEFKIQNGLTDTVTYSFGGDTFEVRPRNVITHVACQPDPVAFERAGPPLIGRTLSGTYLARDGDLFTLRSAPSGGVIIDVSSKVMTPARASLSP